MGFECCHPAVNFIFFACALFGALYFRHPVFLAVSYVCAFAYSVKRCGRRGLIFDLALIPFIIAFALYYGSYTHFGVTVLWHNFAGNNVTLESFVYGTVLGMKAASVMMWFACIHSVFTADKVVYLFGKVSPHLSLFLSIFLRMVPRIKKEAGKINTAQTGIGLGTDQGGFLRRIRNWIRIFSMMISWTIEAFGLVSDSMRSRGSLLKGRRAFSIYRFDNRDRSFVVAMFFLMTVTAMGILLRQHFASYAPKLIFAAVTPLSYVFYAAYAVFCLMPLGLELWTEYRFRKARSASLPNIVLETDEAF